MFKGTRPQTTLLSGAHVVVFAIGVISVGVNLLMLASPIYMLQIFDKVLTSRSLETLLFLTIAVGVALAVMGGLDICRSIVLARLGEWIEQRLSGPALETSLALGARPGGSASDQPLADLSAIRQFLASPGVGALFDAPLLPLFIAVIWIVHPLLGIVALVSAAILACIALASDLLTRRKTMDMAPLSTEERAQLTSMVRSADTLQTMGLKEGLMRRWSGMKSDLSQRQLSTGTTISVLGSVSKAVRLAVQAAILGTGAVLVLDRSISPGGMIACSIILSRALAPVEVGIGSWRQFVSARQAWQRLRSLLLHGAQMPKGLALPAPKGRVTFDKVAVSGPSGGEPLIRNLSFDMPSGAALGITGPSGAGKTTAARLLVGAWPPSAGTVRIDATDLQQWDRSALGRHVGFLPQGAELFPGTIRENIARFQDAPLDDVIAAARMAQAHEVIVGITGGYDAQVGLRGERLSGGQRQRVALARAVFGNPSLVVMDEPDANLDQSGHDALVQTLFELKSRGVSLVVVVHRQKLLSVCDLLLVLDRGQTVAFGSKDAVAKQLSLASADRKLRAVGSPKPLP